MKITFWTKKANKNTNNCYCDYYLKDKDMMETLGVTTNKLIEYEIVDGNFSCLIDTLGDYETIMRKYKITDTIQLEKIIKSGLNKKETNFQTYLGDIKGVAVYKCGKCGKQNYGKGLFCRNCGCKLKESDNGRSD